MSIKSELLTIKGNKELLLAEDVLDWAQVNPKSSIYRALTWDNKKAGHEYRLWQVRRMIVLNITFTDTGNRKFVSLTIDRTRDGGGYRDIDDVLHNKSLYDIMMADALSDLLRIESRYSELKELRPVFKMVRNIRTSRERRNSRKEQRAAAG